MIQVDAQTELRGRYKKHAFDFAAYFPTAVYTKFENNKPAWSKSYIEPQWRMMKEDFKSLFPIPSLKRGLAYGMAVIALSLAKRGVDAHFFVMGAIAFDAVSSNPSSGSNSGSSATVSHTCTGTNLSVWGWVATNLGTAATTGMTYDGNAMTQAHNGNGGKWFYSTVPVTGAKNIVASFSGSGNYYIIGMSFNGANTLDPLDVAIGGNVSGNGVGVAITTNYANSIIMTKSASDSATVSVTGAGHTSRWGSQSISAQYQAGGTYPTTTPGTYTPLWNQTTSGNTMAMANVAVREFTPVGPPNVKTVDGLAKASVKTTNGLAIASVKTINGLN